MTQHTCVYIQGALFGCWLRSLVTVDYWALYTRPSSLHKDVVADAFSAALCCSVGFVYVYCRVNCTPIKLYENTVDGLYFALRSGRVFPLCLLICCSVFSLMGIFSNLLTLPYRGSVYVFLTVWSHIYVYIVSWWDLAPMYSLKWIIMSEGWELF